MDYKKDFKKPSVASTIALYVRKEKKFLVIKRKNEPFKEKHAFPGGYLEVDKEDLYQTGVRELREETGVKINLTDLQLIDVRSNPLRDPRGHVIDVGFLCIKDNVGKTIKSTNETITEWMNAKQLDKTDFAFDHKLFWYNIKNFLTKNNLW